MQVDLSGRVMLITGASSGIGAAAAKRAAASGAKVAITARRAERLEQLARDIEAEGGEALAVTMDATDEASTIAAYDAIESRFGTVDSVVANAGSGYRNRPTDIRMEDFDQLMAINLRGVFLTVREGARRMIAAGSAENERGRIVIVSSLTASTVTTGMSIYAASKAAVQHMGRNLARDWIRQGINVNMILPGYIHTEMNDQLFTSEAGDRFVAAFPRKRLMTLDDVLPMLLFLGSDAARAITGASFAIDDGQGF